MNRRFILAFVAVVAIFIPILVVPLGVSFASREETVLTSAIERDARSIATNIGPDMALNPERIQSIAARYRSSTGGRIVVIGTDGASIADSDDAVGRNFANRAEFTAALAGDASVGTRPSQTAGTDLVFVAVPVVGGNGTSGALRITYPRSELDHRINENWIRLAVMSGLALISSGICGAALASWATKPLRALQRAAGAVRDGDLSARVPDDVGPAEVRLLSSTFNAMAGRTAEVLESQRDFLGDASHQLRTPLTALSLRLEAIADAGVPTQQRDIEAASAEVDRLGRIVNQLLVLTRTDAATEPSVAQSLFEIAEGRSAVWEEAATRENIVLHCDVQPSLMVSAPDGAIEQILDNLIKNAINAFGSTSEPSADRQLGNIRISASRVPAGSSSVETSDAAPVKRPEQMMIRLSVNDDGPGMDDDQMTRCFDRFWRAPGARPGGSGLGLAIVASLARASGGTVSVSRPGVRGCEISVHLPDATTLGADV